MSRKYWEQREYEKLNEQMKDVKLLERELNKQFKTAAKEIEKEIYSLFSKYAKDNNLSYTESARLLTSKEFKEWKYDLKDYMKKIEETADEKLLLELNTLAMKSRIGRLEEMLYQIDKHINATFENFENGAYKLLGGSVSKSYYKTIYDINKFMKAGSVFSFIDTKHIERILSYPWSGKNYSERIWGNRDKLKDVLKTEITQMIIRGEGPKEVYMSVAKIMDVSFSNASRLINTEHSYVMGEASALAMKETGVEQYEILATLDSRTSTICQRMDGQVFYLKDRSVGVNASPFHPRCRTTEIPVIDSKFKESYRFARDKDDKAIKVPSSMKYSEWEEIFIKVS